MTDPERAIRFGNGMLAINHIPGYDPSLLPSIYPWSSLPNSTIVLPGGQRGQAAIALASSFPSLTLIVQDSEMLIQGAEQALPETLSSRIHFQKHELFEPQTTEADIYFFRMVFRNLGDKYAVPVSTSSDTSSQAWSQDFDSGCGYAGAGGDSVVEGEDFKVSDDEMLMWFMRMDGLLMRIV